MASSRGTLAAIDFEQFSIRIYIKMQCVFRGLRRGASQSMVHFIMYTNIVQNYIRPRARAAEGH